MAAILGNEVRFEIDMPDAEAVRAEVSSMFDDMAGRINALSAVWSDLETEVFRLTRKLVVFRKNKYKGRTMSRSYMAQEERIFFWTYDEFRKWEPGPRRPTAYYHDAWHVRQYLENGHPPDDTEVLIDREQDAMVRQLEVARKLNCDSVMISDLEDYSVNRSRIKARLSSGIGFLGRVRPHFLVVD